MSCTVTSIFSPDVELNDNEKSPLFGFGYKAKLSNSNSSLLNTIVVVVVHSSTAHSFTVPVSPLKKSTNTKFQVPEGFVPLNAAIEAAGA